MGALVRAVHRNLTQSYVMIGMAVRLALVSAAARYHVGCSERVILLSGDSPMMT
jgi:hypothetical protein